MCRFNSEEIWSEATRVFNVRVWLLTCGKRFCSTVYGLFEVSSLGCTLPLLSTCANLNIVCMKKKRVGGTGNKDGNVTKSMMVQEVMSALHCASHAAVGCGRTKNGRLPGNGGETG